MARLTTIDPSDAGSQVRPLFDALHDRLGMVPNLARTLANSPAALKGYLAFGEALQEGGLSAKLREQIALTVSEANGSGYCVAAHCAIGQTVGLSDNELTDARQASSPDSRVEAALQFARQVVEKRGFVSDDDLSQVRQAGYGDLEITEIITIVAWNTLANYINHVAETEIDFPIPTASVS